MSTHNHHKRLKTIYNLAVLLTFLFASNLVIAANLSVLQRANIHEIYQLPWSGDVNENVEFSTSQFMTWYQKTYLNNEHISWEIIKDEMDDIGMQHIRYQQYYQGVKVEHGTMIIHLRNNHVVSFNGEIYPHFSSNIEGIQGMLLASYRAAHSTVELKNQNESVYMVSENGTAYLSKVFLAESTSELLLDKLFIDTENQRILRIEPQHVDADAKGTTNTHYLGVQKIITDSINSSTFRLRENARPIRTYKSALGADFYDSDNYWNNSGELIAGDVHYGMQLLHVFMKHKFNWNSYANNNDSMISVMNLTGTGNAFWNLSGNFATFLAGSSSTVGPCAAIDVVGHEFGHGIAEENSGLVYSGESCMLHESFADISGTLLEWYHDSTKYNWLLGERVWAGGIRNMRNPNAMSHPDTYKGKYFTSTGCHNNGEVQNYWFYLMTKGDTATNDFNHKYSIEGMGFEKAMQILYRAVFYYWTPNTTYPNANTHSLQAAKDLFGSCSKELKMTYDAFKAVGLEDTSFKVVDLSHSLIAPKVVCAVIPQTIRLSSKGDINRTVTWYFENGDSSKTWATDFMAQKTGRHTFLLKTEICGNTLWDTGHTVITYQPIAKFNPDKLLACNNGKDTIKITNTSVNYDATKALKYEWTVWPYGTTYTSENLTFPVTDKFDLTFILKSYYQDGCWDTSRATVVVNDIPSISFTTQPSCENDKLKFTNTTDTSNKKMEFSWYLNNVFLTNGYNPQINAKNGGTYPVLLDGKDLKTGCSAEQKGSVVINKNPIPTFKIINPCANQEMLLINTTKHTSPPNYFRWHLPTFKPFNKDTVSIKNGSNATLPVALEYKDQNGCFAMLFDTITIENIKSSFTSVDSICANSDVVLKSNASPKNIALKWFMDEIQLGTDTTFIIKNIKSGKHAVRQEVYGIKCKDIAQKEILVHELPVPSFSIKKDVCDGDTAHVINTTTTGGKTDYKWSWGDGKINGGDSTSHVYHLQKRSESESFIISLMAKESHGCSGVIAKSITVNAPPISDFTYKVNYLTVEFKSVEQDQTFSYNWQFGDGGKTGKMNPTHTYTERQYYDASLQVIANTGCIAQQSKKDVLGKVSAFDAVLKSIRVFPNPGFNLFKIEGFTSPETVEVHISDMNGKEVLVQKSKPEDGQINLSVNLPAGSYTVSLLTKDKNTVLHLIVLSHN